MTNEGISYTVAVPATFVQVLSGEEKLICCYCRKHLRRNTKVVQNIAWFRPFAKTEMKMSFTGIYHEKCFAERSKKK